MSGSYVSRSSLAADSNPRSRARLPSSCHAGSHNERQRTASPAQVLSLRVRQRLCEINVVALQGDKISSVTSPQNTRCLQS